MFVRPNINILGRPDVPEVPDAITDEERQEFYKLLCKQCGLDNVKFFKMTLPTDGTYILVPKEI